MMTIISLVATPLLKSSRRSASEALSKYAGQPSILSNELIV
jgi:hypothetical protein